MTAAPTPRDPGLQPERTALAWRRTALALAVGSLLGARLLAPVLGGAAIAAAVAGLVVALAVAGEGSRRHRQVEQSLAQRGDLTEGPGGALLAVTAAVGVVGGIAALTLVLVWA